jgi:hypothetical protein
LAKYRGRWNPSFVNDYVKLRNRVNREYGEREYDDKVKLERSPGMLRQPEVDYRLEVKPYVAENREKKAFSLEIDEKSQKENALDRIEGLERERILKDIYKESVPLEVQKEQSLPKVQKHDEPVERSEHNEPLQKDVKMNPMEKELQNIELEILKEKQIQKLESQPHRIKVSKNESGEPLY